MWPKYGSYFNGHNSEVSVVKCRMMLCVAETEASGSSLQSVHMLMKKVVFVLSGFENPERSNLRDKAIEMGATYKPDWTKECTHLM